MRHEAITKLQEILLKELYAELREELRELAENFVITRCKQVY